MACERDVPRSGLRNHGEGRRDRPILDHPRIINVGFRETLGFLPDSGPGDPALQKNEDRRVGFLIPQQIYRSVLLVNRISKMIYKNPGSVVPESKRQTTLTNFLTQLFVERTTHSTRKASRSAFTGTAPTAKTHPITLRLPFERHPNPPTRVATDSSRRGIKEDRSRFGLASQYAATVRPRWSRTARFRRAIY